MVTKVKFLILGGGPSGLAFAARLLQLKEKSFLVLEKEDDPGGLCRSRDVDGSPLDIGGGHFLDVRRKNVLDFMFDYLPESEWNQFERITKIRTNEFEIDYPYEANIWQLPMEEQIEHLLSIAQSGSNLGKKMPEKFSDWIKWKLGNVIAEKYMLPYNRKLFSIDLDQLGTYWLYKLPDVSFEDVLRSCLYHKAHGKLPAHGVFYYPKRYGYGEVFKRIGESLGNRLLLNTPVSSLNVDALTVNNEIQAEIIINTIPWNELKDNKTVPLHIKKLIKQLQYSSIDIVYQPERLDTNAYWIYHPDEDLPFHRLLIRHNFSPSSKGHWQEINSSRLPENTQSINHNRYAYPLNTLKKPSAIKAILEWGRSRAIIGLGRWGEWEHMNSDVAIEKSIELAENLLSR